MEEIFSLKYSELTNDNSKYVTYHVQQDERHPGFAQNFIEVS